MKLLVMAFVCGMVFLSSGCDTISDAGQSVRESFGSPGEPRTRVFQADMRATYDAARTAIAQMNFRFLSGGPAQGKIEAVSPVSTNDSLRSSQQYALSIRISTTLDGGSEVSLVVKEILEADSSSRAGQATSTPIQDTPLYEVFFRSVQEALNAPKKG